MGYSPRGRKESDTAEQLSLSLVFLPGEFHGQRSMVGCRPQGHKESDTTERLTHNASPILLSIYFCTSFSQVCFSNFPSFGVSLT